MSLLAPGCAGQDGYAGQIPHESQICAQRSVAVCTPSNTADLLAGIGELPPPETRFKGDTYEAQHDCKRLTGQLAKVFAALSDGRWWCLSHLTEIAGGSEAGVSARIRDLRRPEFGSHRIERRRAGGGLFVYRMCDQKLQEAA